MRKEFGKIMTELIKKDSRIYLITSDFGYGIFEDIKKDYPQHILNPGINEQATIGIASGMALEGFKIYVYGIAPFILKRSYEQVNLDIVEQNANVKLVLCWDYPHSGPTHQINDLGKLCETLRIDLEKPKTLGDLREIMFKNYKTTKPVVIYISKTNDQNGNTK